MRKTLHIALAALFSTLALGAYAQEQTVIWEENWQSGKDKQLVTEVTNSKATYTVNTKDGAQPKYTKIYTNSKDASNLELLLPKTERNESWGVAINDLQGKSGVFTLTFTYNKSEIEITSTTAGVTVTDISKSGATINVPAGTTSLGLVFKNNLSENGRIDNIKLVAGEIHEEVQTVENIAKLKTIGEGKKAVLTLTDARVVFANDRDMFIEDATGAIDFYGCNLPYTAGQVLNGTIEVVYKTYKKLPEVTEVDKNKLVATDGEEVMPNEVSIESLSEAMACKKVKVSGVVTTTEEEYKDKDGKTQKRTNYFLEDEDNNTVQFYRKWYKLEGTDISVLAEGDKATVTGIVVFLNNNPAIGVTAFAKEEPNAIDTVTAQDDDNAPIYNIAGQRVEKAVKGIYIRNGKKFVVK